MPLSLLDKGVMVMHKYISFFKLRFSLGLQYRVAALAGVVTQFTWGFLEIMLYRAFYQENAQAFPMTFQGLVSYIWLQQAFLAFFAAWMMENEIFETIVNGNIAYELCRPVNVYNMWYARSMATRISRAVLRCFPILIVALFLPEPFTLVLPVTILRFAVFIFTLVLGLAVTVAFCMMVYMLAFFTISPQGLRMVLTAVVEFFSGAVIPLPFFREKCVCLWNYCLLLQCRM